MLSLAVSEEDGTGSRLLYAETYSSAPLGWARTSWTTVEQVCGKGYALSCVGHGSLCLAYQIPYYILAPYLMLLIRGAPALSLVSPMTSIPKRAY